MCFSDFLGEGDRYALKFHDSKVCKSFLIGCCPHDILASTVSHSQLVAIKIPQFNTKSVSTIVIANTKCSKSSTLYSLFCVCKCILNYFGLTTENHHKFLLVMRHFVPYPILFSHLHHILTVYHVIIIHFQGAIYTNGKSHTDNRFHKAVFILGWTQMG